MSQSKIKRTLLCAIVSGIVSGAVAGCATTAQESVSSDIGAPVQKTVSHPPSTASSAAASDDSVVVDTTVVKTKVVVDPKDHPDIWSRIRAGYGLAPLDSVLIARNEQYFVNNPEFMQAMMERARLYLYFIVDEVEKRKVPLEIALLPAIESAYKPYAFSRAKAVGLWQFMAPTGRLYGLKDNWWYDSRRDVMASTRAALDYLEKLRDDFNGDWHLALAAYNAGEGRVARMMEYNRKKGLSTDYQHLKLHRETVNYVPRLIAMANIVANPDKYGVKLVSIPNAPYFTQVDAGSQIDLGVVAKLTNLTIGELQYINPHLNRFATNPNGPHFLLIPVDKKDALLEGLSDLPEQERVRWLGHEVRRGESLSEIARRHGVTPEAVRAANKLASNTLRVGQTLMIPVSSRSLPPVITAGSGTKTSPTRPVKQASSAWTAAGKNTAVIHRVRAGETLWGIARRYGVLVSQIINWNLMQPGDVLQLGQRLRIFPSGAPSASIENEKPNG
jgi:membrane-bound lytic murein transglycosylase D